MVRRIASIALFVLLAAVVSGSSCDDDGGDGGSTTTADGTTTTTTTSGGSPVDVRVYFAANEAVATAGRTVEGPAVARGALTALLAGPEGIETEIGQVSEIPEDTELLGVDVSDGVGTVDLTSAFEAGGGSLSMQLRVAQVVFTLTQFDTVDTVDIRLDGEPVDAIGGEGIPAQDLDRAEFSNVTPFVLVESPVPGEAVTSPLEISGMANTFEATVNYTVTDGEGLIVDEGFTTASAGNGTFGTFSATSDFTVDRPGVGAVIGFELSAETGDPINQYEVPVDIS